MPQIEDLWCKYPVIQIVESLVSTCDWQILVFFKWGETILIGVYLLKTKGIGLNGVYLLEYVMGVLK